MVFLFRISNVVWKYNLFLVPLMNFPNIFSVKNSWTFHLFSFFANVFSNVQFIRFHVWFWFRFKMNNIYDPNFSIFSLNKMENIQILLLLLLLLFIHFIIFIRLVVCDRITSNEPQRYCHKTAEKNYSARTSHQSVLKEITVKTFRRPIKMCFAFFHLV